LDDVAFFIASYQRSLSNFSKNIIYSCQFSVQTSSAIIHYIYITYFSALFFVEKCRLFWEVENTLTKWQKKKKLQWLIKYQVT